LVAVRSPPTEDCLVVLQEGQALGDSARRAIANRRIWTAASTGTTIII
jgi:hypothetical protein